MANRFKIRISRLLSSLQPCLCKEHLPQSPHPPVFRVDHHPIPPPASDFQWQKEEKWLVVSPVSAHHRRCRVSCDDASDAIYPEIMRAAAAAARRREQLLVKKTMKKKKKKKKNTTAKRNSTSSADHSGWFSSDRNDGLGRGQYDEEAETLVCSSETFSSDDDSGRDEFYKPRKSSRWSRRRATASAGRRQRRGGSDAAELSVAGVVGKVNGSVAVVKRSEDPCGDFKRSMVEMIVEKELYEAEELERLLRCFLSLNSSAHHGAIVRAFSEILDGIFFSSEVPPVSAKTR